MGLLEGLQRQGWIDREDRETSDEGAGLLQ